MPETIAKPEASRSEQRQPEQRQPEQRQPERRTARRVLLGAGAMVGVYLLLWFPLAWLVVVSFRPASSLDHPPGLFSLTYALLGVAAFAVSRVMTRRAPPLRSRQVLLAALLASTTLTLLWELRLLAGGEAFDAWRVLVGVAILAVLMGPPAWLGAVGWAGLQRFGSRRSARRLGD